MHVYFITKITGVSSTTCSSHVVPVSYSFSSVCCWLVFHSFFKSFIYSRRENYIKNMFILFFLKLSLQFISLMDIHSPNILTCLILLKFIWVFLKLIAYLFLWVINSWLNSICAWLSHPCWLGIVFKCIITAQSIQGLPVLLLPFCLSQTCFLKFGLFKINCLHCLFQTNIKFLNHYNEIWLNISVEILIFVK